MKAIKDHVKDTAEKYRVEIEERRPKVNIVTASRTLLCSPKHNAVLSLLGTDLMPPSALRSYNMYKSDRLRAEQEGKKNIEGQMNLFDLPEVLP